VSQEYELIQKSLKTLGLPPLVNKNEIRKRYLELVKANHSDLNKDVNQKDSNIRAINEAYEILKKYIDNYRFKFDEEEISNQFPKSGHVKRFRF